MSSRFTVGQRYYSHQNYPTYGINKGDSLVCVIAPQGAFGTGTFLHERSNKQTDNWAGHNFHPDPPEGYPYVPSETRITYPPEGYAIGDIVQTRLGGSKYRIVAFENHRHASTVREKIGTDKAAVAVEDVATGHEGWLWISSIKRKVTDSDEVASPNYPPAPFKEGERVRYKTRPDGTSYTVCSFGSLSVYSQKQVAKDSTLIYIRSCNNGYVYTAYAGGLVHDERPDPSQDHVHMAVAEQTYDDLAATRLMPNDSGWRA